MGRLLQHSIFLTLLVPLFMISCAPVAPLSKSQVNLGLDLKKFKSSALSASGNTYSLDSEHCYLIHMTGDVPGFRREPTNPSGEPLPAGCDVVPDYFGKLNGMHNLGANVEILGIPVNKQIRFDLVAIHKVDLGIDINASCPGGFDINFRPRTEDPSIQEPYITFNGVEDFTIEPAKFYLLAKATSTVVAGNNNITLQAVVDPTTNELGRKYFCGDEGENGSVYQSDLYLVAPTMVSPGTNPFVMSGMVEPFLRFECPEGATQVAVSVLGGVNLTQPCVDSYPGNGGYAHFDSVSLPAGYGRSGYAGTAIQISAIAQDSSNSQIGSTTEFRLQYGPRYYNFSSHAYAQTTPSYPTGGNYGNVPYSTNPARKIKFAGYKPHSPSGTSLNDGYLFVSRNSESGAGGNNSLVALKTARSTLTNERPFDWDSTTSVIDYLIPEPNSVVEFSAATDTLFLKSYNGTYNADEIRKMGLIFNSFSEVENRLDEGAYPLSSLTPFRYYGDFDYLNAFASLGNSMFAVGELIGGSTLRQVLYSNVSTFTNPASSPTIIDVSNTSQTSGANEMFTWESPNDGSVFVGIADNSKTLPDFSIRRCASVTTCDTSYQIYKTATTVSSSSGGAVQGAVITNPSDMGSFRLVVAKPESLTINDVPTVFSQGADPIPVPSTSALVLNYNDNTRFFPPISGNVSPRLLKTVEKDIFFDPRETYEFDLVLALETDLAVGGRAVIYRSFNGGDQWYEVYYGEEDTTIDDGIEILRQQKVYGNNGNDSIEDSPGIAFILKYKNSYMGAAADSWKILWQETSGY
jgi:hypothetical protein